MENPRLISDELLVLGRHLGGENYPVPELRQFLRASHIDLPDQDGFWVDEPFAVEIAYVVLNSEIPFPEQGALIRAYENAIRNLEDYFSSALREQRARMRAFISGIGLEPVAALEKRLRNLERGMDRRECGFDRLIDEYDRLQSRTPEEFITSLFRVHVDKRTQRIVVDVGAEVKRLESNLERMARRVQRLECELDDMDLARERLAVQLEFRERLDSALHTIDGQLVRLPVEKKVQRSSRTPAAVNFDDVPAVPRKRRFNGSGGEVREGSSGDELMSKDPEFDAFKVSMELLSRVIEVAEGRIGVVLPERTGQRRRFLNGWTELLQELGFSGEVVPLSYEEIGSRGMPVIVPSRMNTHKGKWRDSAGVSVIPQSSPHLLLNYWRRGGDSNPR